MGHYEDLPNDKHLGVQSEKVEEDWPKPKEGLRPSSLAYPELEKRLLDFLRQLRSAHKAVSAHRLIRKARELGEQLTAPKYDSAMAGCKNS